MAPATAKYQCFIVEEDVHLHQVKAGKKHLMSDLCTVVGLKQLQLAWSSSSHRKLVIGEGGCKKDGWWQERWWQERLGGRSLSSFQKVLAMELLLHC